MEVSPAELRTLRARNNWSLQDLANHSGINKAYLSEFENGKRKLTDEQHARLDEVFEKFKPAGSARPALHAKDGHWRLVFVDSAGNVTYEPPIAHVSWTEFDGTSYSMFVGDRDA